MAKSILLLIERRHGSKGPEIPVRHEVLSAQSEGVVCPDYVLVHITSPVGCSTTHRINGEGMLVFNPPIQPGSYLRAELIGNNSVATVWVE